MQKPIRRRHGGADLKTIAAVVMAALFLLFLFQNSADVDIRFLFWKVTMSRILLLLGCLAIGLFIGLLIGWGSSGRNRKG